MKLGLTDETERKVYIRRATDSLALRTKNFKPATVLHDLFLDLCQESNVLPPNNWDDRKELADKLKEVISNMYKKGKHTLKGV